MFVLDLITNYRLSIDNKVKYIALVSQELKI